MNSSSANLADQDEEQAYQAENLGNQPVEVKSKQQLSGKVIKITLAGAIVDIGQDKPGMLHISRIQKEPAERVEDVLKVGEMVDVWVRRIDPKSGRIELTMFEPLPLEWREIKKGLVLTGKVSRIEKFGVFVEIGAERPGLVHISEITHGFIRTPNEVVKEGEEVEVKVIGVNRRKKRIRLSMKALEPSPARASERPKEEPVEDNEPVPTAMEIALREAMERTKTEEAEMEDTAAKSPSKTSKDKSDLEDILNRTLERESGT